MLHSTTIISENKIKQKKSQKHRPKVENLKIILLFIQMWLKNNQQGRSGIDAKLFKTKPKC